MDEEDFKEKIDVIVASVIARFPDDQTLLRADKGELEEDVYLASILLAHIETDGDAQAIADEFDRTPTEMQADLFNAQHKLQEDGGFRGVVQSAGVHAGISNEKLLNAMSNPPEAFVPH